MEITINFCGMNTTNAFSLIFIRWRSAVTLSTSYLILIIKPTRCTNFSNFIFGLKLYMFRTVPLSIIRGFSLFTQQWYMSYRFADS